MGSTMKDSGLPWIGQIPSTWQCIRGKYILKYLQKPTKDDDGVITCFRDGEVTLRSNRREEGFTISEKEIGYQGIDVGDLVVHGMDGFAGSIGISDSRGKASPVLVVLDSNENKRFLMYYLRNLAYRDVFLALATGIRVRSCDLRWNKLADTVFILPPKSEQKKIVDLIDKKISEIDSAVNEIKMLIEKYKSYKQSIVTEAVTKGLNPNVTYKDSGLSWIGMIPTTWQCIRGKYVLTYLQKPVMDGDGVITCFRDGEVTLRSKRREEGFTISEKEIGYQGIDSGDLVVHGMDGFAGAIGISDSRGKASPVLVVLDSNENKRFIMYFLRSLAYSNVFLALATGIRVRSCDLRWNKLAETVLALPPKEEQSEIVSFLDKKTAEIDVAISQKEILISKLQQYKKSIIFEFVTGKKEVPNG